MWLSTKIVKFLTCSVVTEVIYFCSDFLQYNHVIRTVDVNTGKSIFVFTVVLVRADSGFFLGGDVQSFFAEY